jgi:hypothetical protein
MNCPNCGRFMGLFYASDIGKDSNDSAFWWSCNNDRDCEGLDWCNMPAPEYDWLWWGEGIPQAALDDCSELAQECAEMYQRYINRNARK